MATSIIERIVYEVDDAAGNGGTGGAGGAVLFIHGLGGSSNTWTALMRALQRHRVIRIDLPGSRQVLQCRGGAEHRPLHTRLPAGHGGLPGGAVQSVRHMGGKIADAQVHVLPGCGHWTPAERPDACMELLRRFQPRRTN